MHRPNDQIQAIRLSVFVRIRLTALLLQVTAPLFALGTPTPGSSRRFCRPAPLGWRCRRANQRDQPFQCVLTVSVLGTESTGGQNDHAGPCHSASGQRPETPKNGTRQSRTVGSIEAQLNGTCDLVDVLPAGSGSTNEMLLDLVLGKADGVGDTYQDRP